MSYPNGNGVNTFRHQEVDRLVSYPLGLFIYELPKGCQHLQAPRGWPTSFISTCFYSSMSYPNGNCVNTFKYNSINTPLHVVHFVASQSNFAHTMNLLFWSSINYTCCRFTFAALHAGHERLRQEVIMGGLRYEQLACDRLEWANIELPLVFDWQAPLHPYRYTDRETRWTLSANRSWRLQFVWLY